VGRLLPIIGCKVFSRISYGSRLKFPLPLSRRNQMKAEAFYSAPISVNQRFNTNSLRSLCSLVAIRSHWRKFEQFAKSPPSDLCLLPIIGFRVFRLKIPHSAFRTPNYFFRPPEFFPRRAETNFVCLIIRFLSKTDYAGNPIFQHPPDFTPSAEKHFGPKPGRIGP
jgi:hypothetical protein